MLCTTIVHYQVDWSAVRAQLGTMASLGLFLLLLVPIRIPTLSLTTGEEADFNKEIKAHGIANLASGLCGSVHNYLRCVAMIQIYTAVLSTVMTTCQRSVSNVHYTLLI
jgi:MFS superfamily sulfate permease-like transporter